MSVVASLVAGAIWSALVATLFGPAALVERRDWLLPASLVVPLGIALMGGYFVYRHTARRRKTQAMITVISALFLTVLVYLAALQFLPHYLILRPSVVKELPSPLRAPG
jgi:hypothetical protein